MRNTLTKDDFKHFLKQHFKHVVVITTILTFISFAYSLYSTYFDENNQQTEMEEFIQTDMSIEKLLQKEEEDLTIEESNLIEEYLNQGVYEFSMFIENADSTSFNRSNLLKDFLVREEVVSDIEESLGYNLKPSANQIIETNFNSNNVLMTLLFRTGDLNKSEEIANAYYEYIDNGNLDLFRNRTVHFLSLPEPVIQEENSEIVSTEEAVDTNQTNSIIATVIEIISLFVISLILSSLLSVILVVLFSRFNSKITALFNYDIENQDNIVNLTVNQIDKQNNIMHAILYPPFKRKLILVEDESLKVKLSTQLNKKNEKNKNQRIELASSVSEVNPEYIFDEIIIMTDTGSTTKKWYREQKNQLTLYHLPIKIIKI